MNLQINVIVIEVVPHALTINIVNVQIHYSKASPPSLITLRKLFVVDIKHVINKAKVVFDLLDPFHVEAVLGFSNRCFEVRHGQSKMSRVYGKRSKNVMARFGNKDEAQNSQPQTVQTTNDFLCSKCSECAPQLLPTTELGEVLKFTLLRQELRIMPLPDETITAPPSKIIPPLKIYYSSWEDGELQGTGRRLPDVLGHDTVPMRA